MAEKKPTICFVSLYSPRVVGGVGTYLATLSDGLREKGIDSIIITKKVNGNLFTDMDISEIPFKGTKHLRSVKFYYLLILKIFKMRNEINILNTQTQFFISLIVTIFGYCIGIPVITTIHGPPVYKRKNVKVYRPSLIEKLILNFSKKVVFVDEQGKIDYRKRSGIVIENGVNINKFKFDDKIRKSIREKFKLEDKFTILYTGRWAQSKGIYDLLDSFSKIIETNTNVCLIVLGAKANDIAEYPVKNLNIVDNIIIRPETKEVHEFLCAADLFVLPSYGEGLSLSMLEAMSCSLPVIVTDVGGTPFVINDYVNGLLIKPGDVDDLTKKIIWCYQHEKERKEMGMNARKTIEENHDINKVVNRYIEVYKDLL